MPVIATVIPLLLCPSDIQEVVDSGFGPTNYAMCAARPARRYSTEKSLKEVGDKLDATARGEVESALSELKRVSENGTVAEIRPAIEKLQQASYKMAEVLYKASAPQGEPSGAGAGAGDGAAAGNGASAGPAGEDVIDAEFKEAK